MRNKSTYAPQEKNPKGEVHDDWGLFSQDSARKKLILRQFHIEGFVNQYVLPSENRTQLVFTTESMRTFPPAFERAKEASPNNV